MSIVNGSDLYMWMDGELIAYSTSYTLNVNMEVRPGTNKGSGLWKKVLPGMFDASGSCDGLYVFESSAARIMNAMLARNPVTLQFGIKETGTNDLDTETEHFSGDFYITSFELNATDAENATYSASFVFYDNFGEEYTGDLGGYYVSTTGNDLTGDGSFAAPWLTLEKAWTGIAAGDTIYMRGGTYTFAMLGETALSGKSGTAGNTINIYNYPNEHPIINLSDHTTTTWTTAFLLTGSYINVRGIRICNLAQAADGDTLSKGFSLGNGSSYITVEQVEVDHIGGQGFTQESGSAINNITFLNCDSHHNMDPYSDTWGSPYEAGDGFCYGGASNDLITFSGCRSWSNSDDGWDVRNSNANILWENCWSFWNGYREDGVTTGGDGLGFKTGGKSTPSTTNYLRELHNCLAFENRVHGFDPQPDAADLWFNSRYYNCVAYANLNIGFNCIWYTSADILRNCISYANVGDNINDNASTDDVTCSWNGFTVTNADFVSVYSTGVDGARQTDGSLPRLDFLHLAVGSDLIGAGTNVGLLTDGDGDAYSNPPSIGAFEL